MLSRLQDIARLAILGGALLYGAAASAQTVIHEMIDTVEYGIICDYLPEGTPIDAPGTSAGMVRKGGMTPDFDIETTVVPARPGLAFGLRVIASAQLGRFPVTMVTRHPSFGPGYKTEERWTSTLTGGIPNIRLFFFEIEYEMAPGDWYLEVYDGDILLVQQKFTVVSETEGAELLGGCPEPNLTS